MAETCSHLSTLEFFDDRGFVRPHCCNDDPLLCSVTDWRLHRNGLRWDPPGLPACARISVLTWARVFHASSSIVRSARLFPGLHTRSRRAHIRKQSLRSTWLHSPCVLVFFFVVITSIRLQTINALFRIRPESLTNSLRTRHASNKSGTYDYVSLCNGHMRDAYEYRISGAALVKAVHLAVQRLSLTRYMTKMNFDECTT